MADAAAARRSYRQDMRIDGPTENRDRALGPDLARGFMLLFIALANTHYFLRGTDVLGGYPLHGPPIDTAVTWVLSTFVDGRAYPMFGLLFGYGVARIAARHPDRARRVLGRRAAVLIAVGLTDAVLFFVGDILAAYGVLLLVGLWMIRWRDRSLWLVAVVFALVNAVPSADLSTISRDGPNAAMLPPDLAALVTDRLPAALFIASLGPIGFLCPYAVGLWAGRRRILEHPEAHRRLLTVVATIGVGIAVLGAQPISLLHAGVLTAPDAPALAWLAALHSTAGLLGGIGYAALLALVAAGLAHGRPDRRGPITEAIAATGARSMTCYLLQSVTWAVLFTPFLLDLSGTLTVAGTALVAASTWLCTVLIADLMRRAGRRGPFETLVRRLSYGPRPAPTPVADA
jgi:uncharacterized protein